MLKADKLNQCGIMANYKCTAACRHCLYASSPSRSNGFITEQTAQDVCELLKEGGCESVHIGGGEPFLDFEGLLTLVRVVVQSEISIDYIETNAYWAVDEERILENIGRLTDAGAKALCISVDPFHAEYIPPERPLYLAELCGRTDMGFFLWQQKFLPLLDRLNHGKAHSRKALEQEISPRYIWDSALQYGLHCGGRAVNIEEEFAAKKPVSMLVDGKPCRNVLSTDHFHVDMHGFFIPPGCTGIRIPLKEVVRGVTGGKYPVFEALYSGGVGGLLDYVSRLGFEPDEAGYTSRCALCFHIRHWLTEDYPHAELDKEHYAASLTYYS